MRTLIFEPTITGHHLEYLHHIYIGAAERPDDEFIFAVPHEEWEVMRDKQTWPVADNIRWVMLDDDECHRLCLGSMLAQSWRLSCLIRRIALQNNIDRILLISLAGAIPFLPLMLPSRIKVSGIIYKIYLRAPKKGLRSILDRVRYTIMAHSRSMSRVFILNDPRSTHELNRSYHTDRFVTLPDPVPEVNPEDLRDLKPELGISADTKVFLHFGAMGERKGTLVILRALCVMTKDELADKAFIFAGRVGKSISDEFYRLVEQAKSRGAKIVVRDEFVTYEILNNLCHTADCILMPYLFTDLSSGALGYAAVHNIPVIGPETGLIGELIRDNGLGITIKSILPKELAYAINGDIDLKVLARHDYCRNNSIYKFSATILQH